MSEIPRKFVSLSVAYTEYTPREYSEAAHGKGRFVSEVLGAVADDGTAWVMGTVINGKREHEWLPVKPLPPRVEPDE